MADELGISLFVRKSKESNKAFLSGNWKGSLVNFYVLKRSVTQKPWPGTIPPQSAIEHAATEEFNAWLNEQIRRLQ